MSLSFSTRLPTVYSARPSLPSFLLLFPTHLPTDATRPGHRLTRPALIADMCKSAKRSSPHSPYYTSFFFSFYSFFFLHLWMHPLPGSLTGALGSMGHGRQGGQPGVASWAGYGRKLPARRRPAKAAQPVTTCTSAGSRMSTDGGGATVRKGECGLERRSRAAARRPARKTAHRRRLARKRPGRGRRGRSSSRRRRSCERGGAGDDTDVVGHADAAWRKGRACRSICAGGRRRTRAETELGSGEIRQTSWTPQSSLGRRGSSAI